MAKKKLRAQIPEDGIELTEVKPGVYELGLNIKLRLYSEGIEPETIEPKRLERLEITLPEAHSAKTPYWRNYNLVPIPQENRDFFPNYRESFVLETNVGEIITHVRAANKGDQKRKRGTYISQGMGKFYRANTDLQAGDVLVLEKLGDNRYRMSIKKNR